MGAEGAVKIVFRKELAESADPARRQRELVDDYNEKFANPYIAASLGYLDDVIEPRETRPRLISALAMLESKAQSLPKKKHGNLPL